MRTKQELERVTLYLLFFNMLFEYSLAVLYMVTGAYELPKVVKEDATYAVRRVSSRSKFKTHYLISFLIWKVVSHYLKPHKSSMPNTPSRLNRSARRRLKQQEQW